MPPPPLPVEDFLGWILEGVIIVAIVIIVVYVVVYLIKGLRGSMTVAARANQETQLGEVMKELLNEIRALRGEIKELRKELRE